MADPEMTPDKLSAGTEAIINVVAKHAGENVSGMMVMLGGAIGCLAMASRDPDAAVAIMNRTVEGILSGELLD